MQYVTEALIEVSRLNLQINDYKHWGLLKKAYRQ